jgi:hypothetical protein
MKIKEVNISESTLEKENTPLNPNYSIRERLAGIKPNYKFSEGLNFITQRTKAKASQLSNQVQDFYAKRKKFVIIASILTVIAIITLISLYLTITTVRQTPSYILNFDGNYLSAQRQNSQTKLSIQIKDVIEPKASESPINGILYTKKEYDKLRENIPVAVIIDNHTISRPQSGLSKADLVYEAVTEGGITRVMGIFWSEQVSTVGPIRSARNYFIEWMSPFDPLFVHDGCSASTDSRIDACGNILAYKIKDINTFGAWREHNSAKPAPHNEYSSTVKAQDFADNNGWNNMPEINSLKFKNDATISNRGSKTKVRMAFSDGSEANDYKVEWSYNNTNNSYLRFISDDADIDKLTGKQIEAKVVIIEENDTSPSGDEFGRLIVSTEGSGSAIILQDGKVTTGIWKKENRISRTKYYDKQNNEIVFNRGLIWIASLPSNQGQFTIIEQ